VWCHAILFGRLYQIRSQLAKECYQAFLGVLIDLIMLHYWVLGLDYQSI
jgi:hypothetical protein